MSTLLQWLWEFFDWLNDGRKGPPNMNTPEVPFLLTRWTDYTPTFQNDQGDASIGTTGAIASGSFHIIGRTLVLNLFFGLGTSGTPGSSDNLLVPFPPGYSAADVDVPRMPIFEHVEDTIEGILPALVVASIGAGKSARYAIVEVATTGGVPVANGCVIAIDGLQTLTPPDSLAIRIELPLKEPALPG